MRSVSVKILQIFVSIALLSLVFYQAGLFSVEGRDAFLKSLTSAHPKWLLLSIAVGVLINMSSAFKWYMLVRARDMMVGYWRIFSYYLIGQFCNIFLPTSVGGDVVRSYELGKYTGRQADSLASVFVERYTGVVTLLLCAAIAVLFKLSMFGQQFVLLSLLGFTLLLALMGWLVLDPRAYSKIQFFLVKRFPKLRNVLEKIDKLFASIGEYKKDIKSIVWAFANSFLFYFIAVFNVWVTALVFNQQVVFVDVLIATPVIMLLMNIPLSMGNIGLMEFAYTSVFQIMGYSPALGLSVALLMRAKSLLDGAMGGIMYPIFVTNRGE